MNDYIERTSVFKFKPKQGDYLVGPRGMVCSNKQEAMYYDQVKMCACGNPEAVHQFLIDILSANHEDSACLDSDKIKQLIIDNADSAFQFVLHSLGNCDLVEHGGSVYGSWLTERGKQFIDIGAMQDANP